MQKILVVGSNGQVGQSLLGLGKDFGFEVVGYDLPDIDMTKMESLRTFFEKESPDLVINTAAYTAVDKAEEEHELAYGVPPSTASTPTPAHQPACVLDLG